MLLPSSALQTTERERLALLATVALAACNKNEFSCHSSETDHDVLEE
jgi:hypothetical protein